MGQSTTPREEKAVEGMAVVPNADLADHLTAEAVSLVEAAMETEIDPGDVHRGPQLEMAVAVHLTMATEILSKVYSTLLPKTGR